MATSRGRGRIPRVFIELFPDRFIAAKLPRPGRRIAARQKPGDLTRPVFILAATRWVW